MPPILIRVRKQIVMVLNCNSGFTALSTKRLLLRTLALLLWAAATPLFAATITIPSILDNSIFSDNQSNANGVGSTIYTGRGGGSGVRHGLIQFDVAGSVPAGATIDQVRLTLHLADGANNGPEFVDVNLHRLTASWGEGLSNAGEGNGTGNGIAAQTNDSTWTQRFLNSGPATPWSTAGGDFISTSSADGHSVSNPANTIGQLNLPDTDYYFWETIGTGGMVDDVQSWLDDSTSNFGWLLRGDESQVRTARRFHSREASDSSFRPALFIEYTLASSTPAVPEPTTLWLCAASAGLLMWKRRRSVR